MDKTKTLAIGSDHAGFTLKSALIEGLSADGYLIKDFGAYSTDRVDYPDIADTVSKAVASGQCERAILVCGTGIGMAIAANKVSGIRAAACSEPYSARMSRAHNNANVLGLGERVVGIGLALEIGRAFLETEFESGTRHEVRVSKIGKLDGSCGGA